MGSMQSLPGAASFSSISGGHGEGGKTAEIFDDTMLVSNTINLNYEYKYEKPSDVTEEDHKKELTLKNDPTLSHQLYVGTDTPLAFFDILIRCIGHNRKKLNHPITFLFKLVTDKSDVTHLTLKQLKENLETYKKTLSPQKYTVYILKNKYALLIEKDWLCSISKNESLIRIFKNLTPATLKETKPQKFNIILNSGYYTNKVSHLFFDKNLVGKIQTDAGEITKDDTLHKIFELTTPTVASINMTLYTLSMRLYSLTDPKIDKKKNYIVVNREKNEVGDLLRCLLMNTYKSYDNVNFIFIAKITDALLTNKNEIYIQSLISKIKTCAVLKLNSLGIYVYIIYKKTINFDSKKNLLTLDNKKIQFGEENDNSANIFININTCQSILANVEKTGLKQLTDADSIVDSILLSTYNAYVY
ncbi:hypothetical protein CCFV1_ORF0042 [Cotesia congregata filamentous virus 1]|uniref:Uncharacterized protein n=1 Tax=Cotesia congregata filamentous virus 1 TaxID=3064291 RepID=A0ABC8QJV8_9VIRU|nr:hypothetical protein CCFV1_ORF0042 [Cotesia congregata filamentous virus 1]